MARARKPEPPTLGGAISALPQGARNLGNVASDMIVGQVDSLPINNTQAEELLRDQRPDGSSNCAGLRPYVGFTTASELQKLKKGRGRVTRLPKAML